MALVPYLQPDDLPTAASWNTLFEEFDRKLAAAMDSKPIFFLRGQDADRNIPVVTGIPKWQNLTGKKFFFTAGTKLFCDHLFHGDRDYNFSHYEHWIFQDAAANAELWNEIFIGRPPPPIWLDYNRKIVWIKPIPEIFWVLIGRAFTNFDGFGPGQRPGFFQHSLEAHRLPFLHAGAGAEGTATVVDGRITGVTITNRGANYGVPPIVKFIGEGGTGARARVFLFSQETQFGPEQNSHKLHRVEMLDQGTGYPPDTTVVFETATPDASVESYAVMEGIAGSPMLQEVALVDQAEFILEGVESLVVPPEWNKYNFFRISNLNPYPIEVTFPGHVVTVEKMSSRCVRRDSVTTGYETGGVYFHKFKEGDFAYYNRQNSGRGNNVANLCTPLLFAHYLNTGQHSVIIPDESKPVAGPKIILDYSKMWDASEVYCGEGKPFPEFEENALIGDLLHHRGQLVIVAPTTFERTFYQFEGWTKFLADLPGHGFVVDEEDGNITVTGVGGLISLSCNLVASCTGKIGRDASAGITFGIDRPVEYFSTPGFPVVFSGPHGVKPANVQQQPISIEHYGYTIGSDGHPQIGAATSNFGTLLSVQLAPVTASGKIDLARHTLRDLLNLDWIGHAAYSATHQDTNVTTFTAGAYFTPFGIVIGYRRDVAIQHAPWKNVFSAAGEYHLSDQGVLSQTNAIILHHGGFTDPDNPINFHCSPKVPRIWTAKKPVTAFDIFSKIDYATGTPSTQYAASHFLHVEQSEATAEMPRPVVQEKEEEIKFLRKYPGPYNTSTLLREYLLAPPSSVPFTNLVGEFDVPYSSAYPANPEEDLPLLVDHYNAIASMCNAIVKVVPLDFVSWWEQGGVTEFSPGGTGLLGSNIQPRDCYRSNTSFGFQALQKLTQFIGMSGLPVRSVAHVPQSFAQMLNSNARYVNGTVQNNYEYVDRAGRSPSAEDLELYDADQAANGRLLNFVWMEALFGQRISIQDADPALVWISIEDFKTAVEQFGFKFLFHQVTAPGDLRVLDADGDPETITIGSTSGNSSTSCPVRIPAFVIESLGEFKRTPIAMRVKTHEPASDVLWRFGQFGQSPGYRLTRVRFPAAFRAQNYDGRFLGTQPFMASRRDTPALLLQSYSLGTSKVMLCPTVCAEFQADYTSTAAAAKAVHFLGLEVVPASISPRRGVPVVEPVDGPDHYITPPDDGAYDVLVFIDNAISVD